VSNTTFEQMNLSPAILRVIEEMGYTEPTEIQAKAISILLETEKDFVGQAQTGTGKTAAFVIPLLEKIDLGSEDVQALVLAPTRELAQQVEAEIIKLGKYLKVETTCIYGGTGYEKQIDALNNDLPHIVVGTPGRVIDMIKKGHLKLDKAEFCVLDEADEMLTMGFYEEVQIILESFNKERQLIMFSATMPKQIINIIKKSFSDPEIVKIEKKTLSNGDIDQKYFIVKNKHFKEGLSRLIDGATDMYGIVFCQTKIETREVSDDLKKRGFDVETLHGDMGQAERDLAMKNFKSKRANILVCTDVAARGIDVDNLTHVINYGLPRDNESYVHRIGRTGRAGLKGIAFTIVGPKSAFGIKFLEQHTKSKIALTKLPTVAELKRKVVEKEIVSANDILTAIQAKGADFKTDESFDVFEEGFKDISQDELLKLMFVWKFNKEIRRYNNLAEIEDVENNSPQTRKRERPSRVRRVGVKGPGMGGDKKQFKKKTFNKNPSSGSNYSR